jgi:hypothetical protein
VGWVWLEAEPPKPSDELFAPRVFAPTNGTAFQLKSIRVGQTTQGGQSFSGHALSAQWLRNFDLVDVNLSWHGIGRVRTQEQCCAAFGSNCESVKCRPSHFPDLFENRSCRFSESFHAERSDPYLRLVGKILLFVRSFVSPM